MQKKYLSFVRKINEYCDESIGDEVLFPVFINLWNEKEDITKRDLAVLTSNIISDLLGKDILIDISNENHFESGYGLYKILPHKNL